MLYVQRLIQQDRFWYCQKAQGRTWHAEYLGTVSIRKYVLCTFFLSVVVSCHCTRAEGSIGSEVHMDDSLQMQHTVCKAAGPLLKNIIPAYLVRGSKTLVYGCPDSTTTDFCSPPLLSLSSWRCRQKTHLAQQHNVCHLDGSSRLTAGSHH